ncbi:30S ribosomal protein S8 [archaeon]|jgi:small subunit ribosomal protein S8|nr:30S ribosomal protein S8 [archaeon]MBT6824009.1 30S ribosomal protein S8 [archaeon]MBT7107242.1 30S ribosomal protein S8 [archaeon]MBT7297163.1 30S ribosomal protein S8 [archaeon]
MALNDTLANALSHLLNTEKAGKRDCVIQNSSKFMEDVLKILKETKYIGEFKVIETNKGNHIEVNLISAINKCGAIKPRFPIKKDNYEKFEKRYLPAKGFGILVVSTSKGMMTHVQAMEKGIGGKLIAYCY